ncbi:hypothetical protein [Roseicyclus marinus]|uniref:hypothetical protein n=2 Tax=Roseicyclus marinus TaxID=2161673 RepID=UPI00241041FD|nr:hypothetical protein [Roseicyclus marinus]MDG3042967.1 hypothetical protein [Roseicyclus marinus]
MNGTVIASVKAQIAGRIGPVLDSPNAVIAALVVSTCVAATAGYVVTSRAMGYLFAAPTEMAMTDLPASRAERPAPRVRPALSPADPAAVALGFVDSLPARALPPRLDAAGLAERPPRVTPGAETAPAVVEPVRIVAGRPAVVPPLRPRAATPAAGADAGLVQLATGLTPARALGLPGPVARPDAVAALAEARIAGQDAAATRVAAAAASLRPALRPATLSTRAPVREEADAVITLAAATAPDTVASPRALDPVAPRAGANPCSRQLARDIPRRPNRAAGGAAVMAAVGNGSGSSRDSALATEALRGNIPDHLRDLQPVRFAGTVGGRQTEITICVTPDYLAIGSDADHVRVPLGLPAALRVAEGYGMMLPTTRMVDAIYAQADVRVQPSPMPPTSAMSSTEYFLRHNQTVAAQFARAGARPGLLVAGHKKDVVIANRLANAPGRVAIYGWHRSNGDPIQPLSTVHGASYADYSHGIRLVARTAYVDGRAVDLRGLLTDGQYAGLLNSDGPLSGTTVRLAALR